MAKSKHPQPPLPYMRTATSIPFSVPLVPGLRWIAFDFAAHLGLFPSHVALYARRSVRYVSTTYRIAAYAMSVPQQTPCQYCTSYSTIRYSLEATEGKCI
eukprot:624430-Rhodomonas_salina.1